MTKLILACLVFVFLHGCAGTVITKQNALKECPFFNVPCKKINQAPEFPVEIVGNEIADFCVGGNEIGCLANKTIFLKQKDWKVLGHERCHNYCGSSHYKKRRVLSSIISDARGE